MGADAPVRNGICGLVLPSLCARFLSARALRLAAALSPRFGGPDFDTKLANLAESLACSPDTVERALDELKLFGLIECQKHRDTAGQIVGVRLSFPPTPEHLPSAAVAKLRADRLAKQAQLGDELDRLSAELHALDAELAAKT